MRDIIIALQATEEDDLCFIVTPGNDLLFGQLGAALAGLEKTLAQLDEPNPVAIEQLDYVRTLLGKSVLVIGQPQKRKGRMQ